MRPYLWWKKYITQGQLVSDVASFPRDLPPGERRALPGVLLLPSWLHCCLLAPKMWLSHPVSLGPVKLLEVGRAGNRVHFSRWRDRACERAASWIAEQGLNLNSLTSSSAICSEFVHRAYVCAHVF